MTLEQEGFDVGTAKFVTHEAVVRQRLIFWLFVVLSIFNPIYFMFLAMGGPEMGPYLAIEAFLVLVTILYLFYVSRLQDLDESTEKVAAELQAHLLRTNTLELTVPEVRKLLTSGKVYVNQDDSPVRLAYTSDSNGKNFKLVQEKVLPKP